ncbi:hypothetical protein FIA56_09810 [Testudinibacter sp. TR-2022]|uniref:hypothetical protein n=3 Tax=Testudinibacter sp. TR-2022 TaxID=2585029 RepID=UPI00111A32EF|nr:hypothetical protein [Testudinibacter sp. TR-2022]TNH12434.1 hypothetical protein FIA56_09810 [Testudinibacter sp. TR-2022]TNH19389.1 hypothetical protein FHQ23_03210 [Testudinibacter sp. TR-2022]
MSVRRILFLFLILFLSACSIKENAIEDAKWLAHYRSQLITDNQPYATLRIYPITPYFGYSTLDVPPINIYKVNDKILKNDNSFLGKKYELLTPYEKVMVPVGNNTIIISISNRYAKFENIHFEANKDYIVYLEDSNRKNLSWRVYEYSYDNRFNPRDKDAIILGKPISNIQKSSLTQSSL